MPLQYDLNLHNSYQNRLVTYHISPSLPLSTDFIPEVAEGHLPGLPAYIIFMCIRHADFVNDDRKVKALLTGVINGIKKTVKVSVNDVYCSHFYLLYLLNY